MTEARWWVGATLSTVVVTVLVLRYPAVGLALPVGLLALLGVMLNARIRLVVLIVGAISVFHSVTITPAKLGYLGVCAISAAIALGNLSQARRQPWARPLRQIFRASILLSFVLSITYLTRDSSTGSLDWIRDALPYYLLALAPLIALDIGQHVPAAWIKSFVVVVAVESALASGLSYAQLRNSSALTLSSVLLATSVPASLGFCYALVRLANAERRGPWILAVVAIPIATLVGGSRTTAVLLVFAVVGVCGSVDKRRIPPLRMASIAIPALTVLVIFLPLVAGAITGNSTYFRNRVEAATSVIHGGAANDPSYIVRANSYRAAAAEIVAHPVLGTSPGYRYDYSSITDASDGQEVTTFTLDTPLATVAKLGGLGAVVLVLYLLTIANGIRGITKRKGHSDFRTACRGFAFVFIAEIPFGSFLEDKGMFFTLLLILAVCTAEAREDTSPFDVHPICGSSYLGWV